MDFINVKEIKEMFTDANLMELKRIANEMVNILNTLQEIMRENNSFEAMMKYAEAIAVLAVLKELILELE